MICHPRTEKNNLLIIVSQHFDDILNRAKAYAFKCGFNFDYDIFMDTILNCNEHLNKPDTNMPYENCLLYILKAFRNNTIKTISNSPIMCNISDDMECYDTHFNTTNKNIIYDTVLNIIRTKFGDNILNLFILHCNGVKYKSLIQKSGIRNLKYKFRCIREFMRKEMSRFAP